MSRSFTFATQIIALVSCALVLSGCVGLGQSGLTLSEQLTGNTVIFDGPSDLPAERTIYNGDGTVTRYFRPLLLPDRLSKGDGYWWIENNRYCTSGNPRVATDVASCYTVRIRGDHIRFTPWNRPRLMMIFPELRRERTGRLVLGAIPPRDDG